MSLIKCKECQKEFSSNAKACPNCGAPNKKTSGCAMLFLILFGTIVVVVVYINSTTPKSPPPTASQITEKQKVDEEAKKQELAKLQANLIEFKKGLQSYNLDYQCHIDERSKRLVIIVDNSWHSQHYQNRLQAAQNLLKVWTKITSDPYAKIEITDFNGNTVGGSHGALSGAWVNKE